MVQIDILRHGECEGGEIFRGSTDVALTTAGWAQMQRAVDSHGAGTWQGIVSSPLQRCRRFAEEQARVLGLPLRVDEDWRELNFGDWEGQERADLLARDPAAVESFYRDPVGSPAPGGESVVQMQARVAAAFARCLSMSRDERVLLVAHGGVIRALLALVLGMELKRIFTLDVPYACLSGIEHLEERGISRLIYHNPHAF